MGVGSALGGSVDLGMLGRQGPRGRRRRREGATERGSSLRVQATGMGRWEPRLWVGEGSAECCLRTRVEIASGVCESCLREGAARLRFIDADGSEIEATLAGFTQEFRDLIAKQRRIQRDLRVRWIRVVGRDKALLVQSGCESLSFGCFYELPHYATADERIVEITGEYQKVLKALEAVVGHLRKFLVDHSVLPLFEKFLKMPAAQDREPEAWGEKTQALTHSSHNGIGNDYGLAVKRDSIYLDRESQFDSQFPRSNLSLYGQDPALSGLKSSGLGLGRTAGAVVTQVTQTMQIPLSYAEDIIGIGGDNIAYIRRTSGAILTVQETRGVPDEITVEIKGNALEVQKAQQIIQDFLAAHKGPAPSSYGSTDTVLRSSYSSHLGGSSYSSSLWAASLSGYGSTGLGGYGSYRYGFSG